MTHLHITHVLLGNSPATGPFVALLILRDSEPDRGFILSCHEFGIRLAHDLSAVVGQRGKFPGHGLP